MTDQTPSPQSVVVPLSGAPYSDEFLQAINGFATGGSTRCRDALEAEGAFIAAAPAPSSLAGGAIDWLMGQRRIQASASVRNGNATVNHEEIVGFIDAILAALTPRHEAPASEGEREPLCMAYKTGYAEGVEDSNGMFDRESCEEGWGQYAEKLSAQPALPARLPLPTVDDGRGGRRPINPQDDR